MPLNQIVSLVTNVLPKTCRYEVLEGIKYLVAPMAMMVPGVHWGSGGPTLYTAEELSKTPSMWDHKPIVVYHPMLNGKPISACDPIILEKQKVGILMNTKYDNKLRAEAWLQDDKIDQVDPRIREFLQNGTMMEVSTGVYVDAVKTPGVWNNESYTEIAINHRPDHLALLPDKVGACSIADGAGLLQVNADVFKKLTKTQKRAMLGMAHELIHINELSHKDLRSKIYEILDSANKNDETYYCYIEAVYDSYFIYECKGLLYWQSYTVKDNVVSLSGAPTTVSRAISYVTADGKIVGNNQPEEISMPKKSLVDGLIANKQTKWAEADREFLMKQDDATLEKFVPVANEEDDEEDEEEESDDPDCVVGKKAPTANVKTVKGTGGNKNGGKKAPPVANENEEAPKEEEIPTNNDDLEKYLEKMPKPIANMVRNGIRVEQQQKAQLIKTITANANNTFDKDYLAEKDLAELEAIAKLAGSSVTANEAPRRSRFIAPTSPTAPRANGSGGTPLRMPRMNFDAAPAK